MQAHCHRAARLHVEILAQRISYLVNCGHALSNMCKLK